MRSIITANVLSFIGGLLVAAIAVSKVPHIVLTILTGLVIFGAIIISSNVYCMCRYRIRYRAFMYKHRRHQEIPTSPLERE